MDALGVPVFQETSIYSVWIPKRQGDQQGSLILVAAMVPRSLPCSLAPGAPNATRWHRAAQLKVSCHVVLVPHKKWNGSPGGPDNEIKISSEESQI